MISCKNYWNYFIHTIIFHHESELKNIYGNHNRLIFQNRCSYHYEITSKKEKTIDLLYKLLKFCILILKSFNPSANGKRYMAIRRSSSFIMVVITIRESREKKNKPLIYCIDYLNRFYSYYNLPTQVQIEKQIW